MISYKDMTFCPFHRDCAKASTCQRPLTEEVIEKAQEVGLPITQFVSEPECHVTLDA